MLKVGTMKVSFMFVVFACSSALGINYTVEMSSPASVHIQVHEQVSFLIPFPGSLIHLC